MSAPFTMFLRVRYGECDAQNVVFNARYADYVDVVGTEFLRNLPGGYQGMLEQGIDTQVVNLTLNWKNSARFDDVLRITVEPQRIGTTSYTLCMQFYKGDENTPLCTADITYVIVNNVTYQKQAIPEEIKGALHNAGAGITVNQAG